MMLRIAVVSKCVELTGIRIHKTFIMADSIITHQNTVLGDDSALQHPATSETDLTRGRAADADLLDFLFSRFNLREPWQKDQNVSTRSCNAQESHLDLYIIVLSSRLVARCGNLAQNHCVPM